MLEANSVTLTEYQYTLAEGWSFNISLIMSVGFFVILFLFLLGERLACIKDIIVGIEALRDGKLDHEVPVAGKNELATLAESVNYLSNAQRQLREKEQALNVEKEQLIRSLSHDIRTPLTSILSYSEFLAENEDCPPEIRREQLLAIRKKSEQIRDLTAILLDGSHRNAEYFEDARLLMEQLADEFAESLEDTHNVSVRMNDCPAFSGSFDTQELRRVFDNLITNAQKYADIAFPVCLDVFLNGEYLVIRQHNVIAESSMTHESYKLGLNSIRRIAQNYSGKVDITNDGSTFEITISLSYR